MTDIRPIGSKKDKLLFAKIKINETIGSGSFDHEHLDMSQSTK